MAIPPFGKARKSARYHAPSGPNSPGRMPKRSTGNPERGGEKSTTQAAPETEDTYARRVRVVDYDPPETQR